LTSIYETICPSLLTQLQANPYPFVELFRQEALSVEIYKPEKFATWVIFFGENKF
jgi:hypothetical protein